MQLTNDVVFDDLWRRPDLSVRDRSLVTIAALAAMGDDDQLDVYLRRGLESGLTRAQIAEALTHLGFYAGWPKATKALTAVAKTLGQIAERTLSAVASIPARVRLSAGNPAPANPHVIKGAISLRKSGGTRIAVHRR